MVELIYDGNLGNNLFQYCFARILAEKLGYRLQAKPIAGFPRTHDVVDGKDYSSAPTLILRGQKPDLTFLRSAEVQHHLLLTGYFQRYEYYEKHAQSIRNWLTIEDNIDFHPREDDIVLGIRRGRDYIPQHGLPISYYETALASTNHERVFVCTNDPGDPFITHFKKKYGAVVRAPGAIDNLVFIKKFRKIVISNSTFLWWAAFLSNAQEIVFPRPSNGFWSSSDPTSKNISLEVYESRYRYLDCQKYRSEFPGEVLRNHADALLVGIKARIKRQFPSLATKKEKAAIVFHETFDE